jgi:hypothetical protein
VDGFAPKGGCVIAECIEGEVVIQVTHEYLTNIVLPAASLSYENGRVRVRADNPAILQDLFRASSAALEAVHNYEDDALIEHAGPDA